METASQTSPENVGGVFSFGIGDKSFGFEGGLTKGRFTGIIRGPDGNEFEGVVEDLGNGQYLVEDWNSGRKWEPLSEQAAPLAAELPVGLEDAAAVAAAEAAPAAPQKGLAGYQLIEGSEKDGKLLGRFRAPDGKVWDGIAKLGPDGKVEIQGRQAPEPEGAPAKSVAAPAPEPEGAATPVVRVEIVAGLPTEAAEPAPVLEPQPDTVAAPAEAAPEPTPTLEPAVIEKPLEESRHPLVVELQQKMQSVSRPLRAVRLWKQGESARSGVEGTKSKAKIERLFTQERELKDQAKELYPGIEQMTDAERGELSRKIVPLSAEGTTEAIRISSPKHREDIAVYYEAELQKWESILRDSGNFEQYRAGRAEVESQKNMAKQIFSEEGDKRLLDQAIARIEQRGSDRLKELGVRLPRRLLELAGFIPSESPTLEQVQSDMDLRLAYNRAAQRLYSELTGQPQAVQSEIPAASEVMFVPEPIAPLEPVEQPVVETTVEEVMPAAEVVAEPEVAEQAAEVIAPPVTEGEAAPEPVEEPIEATVVVDEKERARVAAAKPAEAAPASAEASAGEAETPEQRFERRKQGFAGALAGLEQARNDRSGTEGEQRVRLAEAYNQAIGAAMEFMEEGETAKEVVKGFFAGALGTPGGRKLTEVAVRSRMDEAGVFQAATPEERKKKLEEAGLWGLLALLLELGMSFTDKSVGAIVSEVQSATGAGR